jgi:hypothetical protein
LFRKLKAYAKLQLDFTRAQHAGIAEHSRQDMSLCAPGTSTIKPPEFTDAPTLVHQGNFPDIQVRVLHDVIVSPYSPLVVHGKHLLRPPHLAGGDRGRIITASAGLAKNFRGRTFAAKRAQHHVPTAINLGVAGAFNWYHFLLEFLPKLWLAQRLPEQFDDFILLLPEECRNYPSFAVATDLFLDGRRVLYVSKRTCVRADRLVTIDDVSIGPFNMVAGEWPRYSDYAQHDGAVRDYARAVRDRLLEGTVPSSDGDRIFLARPGERRRFNQNELIEIAKGFGYTPVYPEKLTLREQAEMFSRTTRVIGASGAAWSGMMFCTRPMKGLSWLPAAYREFSTYSSLAHILGHKLLFVEAEYDRILDSTGAAYEADYRVCPIAFENALKILEKDFEG